MVSYKEIIFVGLSSLSILIALLLTILFHHYPVVTCICVLALLWSMIMMFTGQKPAVNELCYDIKQAVVNKAKQIAVQKLKEIDYGPVLIALLCVAAVIVLAISPFALILGCIFCIFSSFGVDQKAKQYKPPNPPTNNPPPNTNNPRFATQKTAITQTVKQTAKMTVQKPVQTYKYVQSYAQEYVPRQNKESTHSDAHIKQVADRVINNYIQRLIKKKDEQKNANRRSLWNRQKAFMY